MLTAGLGVVLAAPALHAQAETLALTTVSATNSAAVGEKNALEKGRYAVLIDLDENRLYFKQGEMTLWSAPVGTGTGMRVITEKEAWKFSTPRGRFQIQYKERNPVWIAPDWFYVENNLPIPPRDHPSRYMKGTLGEAAVYISPDLAIHGTDRPELIGQRVSHGCIRLENRYAVRLYNSVQVGTEVIIVGGEDVEKKGKVVDLRKGYDPSLASKGKKPPPPPDPIFVSWTKMNTDDLRDALEEQLEEDLDESRWDQIAGILLERASDGDEGAMEALFEQSTSLPSVEVEREWATLLAEAYRSAPVRSLAALSDLRLRERRQAADLIVSAMLTLYNGEYDAPSTPWPTNRIPHSLVSRNAERGWEALVEAEKAHREKVVVVQNEV